MAEITIVVRDDTGTEISVSRSNDEFISMTRALKTSEMEDLFAKVINEMCDRMGLAARITRDASGSWI